MTPALHPYPAYKPSGIEWLGDVPEHWKVNRLKVHLLLNDSGVWGDDFHEEGAMVLRSTEQTVDGGWSISNPARIRLPRAEQDAASLEENDLVITKSSGSKAHIGKTSVVTSSIAAMNCCFSNFMQRIRLDAHVSPLLIWYLFNSSTGREQLVFQSTSTTGLGNLNGEIIANCYFTFPPLDEQSAIVRYLDYVDRRVRRYVEAKRKLIALLEEERKAVIHQAVTRGLDPNVPLKPSGVEWLGDVPAHWERCRLRNVVSEVTTGSRDWSSYASDTGPLFIRIANLRRGSLQLRFDETVRLNLPETSEAARTRIQAGDLLISVTAYIGSIGIAPKEIEEAYVSQHVARCKPRPGSNSQWLGYVLLSAVGQTHGQITLYGGTKEGLSLDDVKNYPILLPPLSEQHAIVEYLDKANASIDAATDRARRQIELVEEYRTRLIADVVTGKLDVRAAAGQLPDEADDEHSMEVAGF